MTVTIAHLGPRGTYAEAAALECKAWITQTVGQTGGQIVAPTESALSPYPSIGQALQAVIQGKADFAVVPVENSIEGGVTMTLDGLWGLETLQIQRAIVLPIAHALISQAGALEAIQTVYSHPQALAQCRQWMDAHLPTAQAIAVNSTTEALKDLSENPRFAGISSARAAQLYNLPILAYPINDYPDNCTRFLVLSLRDSPGGSHTSLAFSVTANQPGALLKPLQIFAQRHINLSRIESRPTKRSLGDYLFFLDLEADAREEPTQAALAELASCAETLKLFGSYDVISLTGE